MLTSTTVRHVLILSVPGFSVYQVTTYLVYILIIFFYSFVFFAPQGRFILLLAGSTSSISLNDIISAKIGDGVVVTWGGVGMASVFI